MELRIEVLYPTWRGRRYSHNNRKCLHKETLFIVVDGISFYVIVVANGEWVEEVARRLFVMQMCFVPFSYFSFKWNIHPKLCTKQQTIYYVVFNIKWKVTNFGRTLLFVGYDQYNARKKQS